MNIKSTKRYDNYWKTTNDTKRIIDKLLSIQNITYQFAFFF